MPFIEAVNLIDPLAERQHGGDDSASAGAEDKIETLMDRATKQGFNFSQYPKCVETFGSPTIETQDAKQFVGQILLPLIFAH